MSKINIIELNSNNFSLYKQPITELYKNVFHNWLAENPEDDKKIERKFERYISYKASSFFLLFEGETLIGYCGGFSANAKFITTKNKVVWNELSAFLDLKKTFYIVGLGTLAPYRRRGYAKQLLEKIISQNKEIFPFFLIKTFDTNTEALNLYQNHFHFKRNFVSQGKTSKGIFLTLDKSIKKVKFIDLLPIVVKESGDDLVEISKIDPSIKVGKEKFDTPNLKVRKDVALKLKSINKKLMSESYNRYCLNITSAYQDVHSQKKNFVMYRDKLAQKRIESENLYDFIEQIHQYVSVPSVAGYPTGGAIDLTIFDNDTENFLNMGSCIYEFSSSKASWFAESLNNKQRKNRQLLFELMVSENFAPFWKCWWRYSYGDKSWAKYYDKENAIYDHI
ncbi:MAG: GNAT family N-acetyltransferase [Leptospiraceae bacterium]|nr:GNAT family N-acetyltransferase [Leptospiraceae bacterium]MCP5495020.1 GNAT family N-acetyltransferase [Leptospiraceae bacterium]